MRQLDCAGRVLVLDRPRIAGIVNLTDDSFSGDGLHGRADAAIAQALAMVEAGADLLDIGAESTRPGAESVTTAAEIARLIPVIEALARQLDVPISVDTSKPEVMRAAVAAGAGLINDVYALRREGALEAAAELGVPVCVMHMQGEPRSMQADPRYDDVVAEVRQFLVRRVAACAAAGIDPARVLVDPGFGFGKTTAHNMALLAALEGLAGLGGGLLVGFSRKRSLGEITGRAVDERVHASVAVALMAAERGADIVRVHDVAATTDVLKILAAVNAAP